MSLKLKRCYLGSRTMLLRPCERVRWGRGRPPIRDRGWGEAEESPPREGSETGFELEPLLHVWSASSPKRVDMVIKDGVKNDQAIVADQTVSVVLIVVKMTDVIAQK